MLRAQRLCHVIGGVVSTFNRERRGWLLRDSRQSDIWPCPEQVRSFIFLDRPSVLQA